MGNKPRKGVVRQCLFCGADVYVGPYRAKTHSTSYCSQEHFIAWAKEESFSFECFVCGKKKFTQPIQMVARKRPACSVACRSVKQRRDAEARHIEKGYTKFELDRFDRFTPETTKWRKAVFERDNYTCQLCGVRGTYLEADHIKPWAYFPELRRLIDNGRTLCKSCHQKTKVSWKEMRELYSKPEHKT